MRIPDTSRYVEKAGEGRLDFHLRPGLELVAIPKEARAKLGLDPRHVLLITDIADEAPAGLRAHARVGDVLWRVGRTGVTSPRDIAQGIVTQAARSDTWRAKGGHALLPTCTVRYVIGIRRPNLFGTNTQSMKLPRKQVDVLRTWLENNPEMK